MIGAEGAILPVGDDRDLLGVDAEPSLTDQHARIGAELFDRLSDLNPDAVTLAVEGGTR